MEASALGRYQVRGEIGRGTMGVVYRGYDPVLDRPVALKTVLLSSALAAREREHFLQRFFLEARIAGKLIHPNIVVTYDAATDEATGTPFIAMELVEGESLSQRLERAGKLPWKEALDIGIQIARALDYAHQNGIVHRDVKPANVLLWRGMVPKIADFGVAKVPAAHLTQSGMILGTPYFMSPEHLGGEEVDGRSDLFSLGAVLYNLLTGRRPFEATELTVIAHQVLHRYPARPSELSPELPRALDDVLARAMAKVPADRHASGAELAEALAAVRRGELPRPAPPREEKTRVSAPQPQLHRPPSRTGDASTETARVAGPRRGRRSMALFGLLLAMGAGLYLWRSELAGVDLRSLAVQAVSYLEPLGDLLARNVQQIQSVYHQTREAEERLARLGAKAEAFVEQGRPLEAHGQWKEALAAYDQALALCREAGDGPGEALALLSRGRLRSHWGEPSRARADLESAEAVYRIYGLVAGQAQALTLLGNLERDRGEFEKAASLYERAFSLAERDEDKAGVLSQAGFLELLRGRWAAARERLESARSLSPASGERETQSKILLHLGALAYVLGEREAASSWWETAGQSPEARSTPESVAQLKLLQGLLALDAREPGSSRRHLQEAETYFRDSGHLPGLVAALEKLAELDETEGNRAEAQLKVGEARELRMRLGVSADADAITVPAAPSARDRKRTEKNRSELDRLGRLLRLLGTLPRTPLEEERLGLLLQKRERLEAPESKASRR